MRLKSFIITGLVLCLTISVSAQKRLNLDSNTTTKTYSFSNYTALEVSGDFKINLNVSSSNEAIALEANSNLMDKIDIHKDGNTLVLKLKSMWNYRGNMILNVDINTKGMINDFALSGDAIVNVKNPITSNSVTLNLRGDSVLDANIKAKDVSLVAKSDSVVTLSGTIDTLDAKLSSDSLLKGKALTVNDVEINLSGDSQAWIIATSALSAHASGDSVLRYSGDPKVKVAISTGDSEIHRMN